jgi:signal transduction histidine kinase
VLVVLSDVSTALRENERDAWRRLIRVMGHEINNSLTPIRSMSEALLAELAKPPPRPPSFEDDIGEALGVIARRSDALGRFMSSYARLAKLPPPRIDRAALAPLVEKVALLERRVPVTVEPGPDAVISADIDQLEQVLINLVKNAAEASLGMTASAAVRVTWTTSDRWVDIAVEDEGTGIADTTNLFVPFFTTKPEGSGIGLVLAREIVEAHKGELTLRPRREGNGTIANIRLPRA